MSDIQQVFSLSDFLRNHKEHVTRLKESRAAEVLTINGKAELVLQEAGAYQAMLDRLQRLEDLAAVREGLAQADAGMSRPADEFFAEFTRRHGIQG
jgi:hypothetical protein